MSLHTSPWVVSLYEYLLSLDLWRDLIEMSDPGLLSVCLPPADKHNNTAGCCRIERRKYPDRVGGHLDKLITMLMFALYRVNWGASDNKLYPHKDCLIKKVTLQSSYWSQGPHAVNGVVFNEWPFYRCYWTFYLTLKLKFSIQLSFSLN